MDCEKKRWLFCEWDRSGLEKRCFAWNSARLYGNIDKSYLRENDLSVKGDLNTNHIGIVLWISGKGMICHGNDILHVSGM